MFFILNIRNIICGLIKGSFQGCMGTEAKLERLEKQRSKQEIKINADDCFSVTNQQLQNQRDSRF